MPDPVTLYVHVPFCVVKCGYCDFNSYAVADSGAHDRFLTALDRELELQVAPSAPSSVFVGGGTPTYLAEPQFARLFEILGRHVDLRACAEVTIEGNPESCSAAKFEVAVAAGVDRVSLGVQSFDPDNLTFLDRRHRADDVSRAVRDARAEGIGNLSLDLIYGLPGQSLESWDRDLEQALALDPDHLSCYQLTYEPGTRLTKALREEAFEPLDQDREAELFRHTHARLGARGFDAYEVSNFAGRGGPSRHNQHYWNQGDYLGVGPGAASHRNGWRWTNLKPLEAWCSAVERGLPAAGEGELLTRERRLGEAVWLGLRQRDGIDLEALRGRLGPDVSDRVLTQSARFVDQHLMVVDGHRLFLSDRGRLLADAISETYLA